MPTASIATSTTPPFTIARLDAHVFRWPVKTPVRTSFGTMVDRPAVFIRVESSDGAVGWGEAWCNFPGCGAEHRARLLESVIAPLMVGREFASPVDAFDDMSARTAVLAIQSGEPGPIAQTIAGTDLALWDLVSRRAGLPLWRLLGGTSDEIAVYASGINPDRPQDVVAERRARGYRAFKLKLGFGDARDLQNLAAARDAAGPSGLLMTDANQGWDLDTALRMSTLLDAFGLAWLEEPLRADRPIAEWQRLAAASPVPLAGGENLIGHEAFDTMIASRAQAVMQPDLAKWGGISGCLPVIERIQAAGLRYCPHYLGGGLGQMASAHVLAAVGTADGMLEIDANENPLRTASSPALDDVREGRVRLGETPGVCAPPDLARLRDLCESARQAT